MSLLDSVPVQKPKMLGELRRANYRSARVKDEMRAKPPRATREERTPEETSHLDPRRRPLN